MENTTKKRIFYLIDRCIQRSETPEEREELNAFYLDEGNYSFLQEALLHSFYQEKELTDIDTIQQHQMVETVISSVAPKSAILIKPQHLWKWAAAAILILVFFAVNSTDSLKVFSPRHSDIEIAQTFKSNAALERHPAKEMALLQLADGSKISLEHLEHGKLLVRDGLSVERSYGGDLFIKLDDQSLDPRGDKSQWHTITTPRGGTYKIILPDGSVVHLNSASKLSFPTRFSANDRTVNLEGEAYFEVAKEVDRQFIVRSGRGTTAQEIKVYGTKFNLAAYAGDPQVKTTLVEGSIKIRSVATATEKFLKPNQTAIVTTEGLTIMPANIQAALAWKNNVFYFADEPVQGVVDQLSRWYDIDISYQGDVLKEHFWGQISRSKKLSEVIEILENTNDLKFLVQGKEVIVAKK